MTTLAIALRAAAVFNSGIWADEAFFVKIVHADSWGTMMAFLRWHESHPPLFYVVTRVWVSVFGSDDAAALWLAIIIGAGIVPAVYAVGASLFGRRVGILAAAMASVSPALIEHSAQLRPYGLLALLVLASCYSMVQALARGGLYMWAAYVVSTLMLVYTHNWTWVVVAGQHVTTVVAVRTTLRHRARASFSGWLGAWVVIAAGFLPWAAALLFQAKHAGHPGYSLHGLLEIVVFVFLAVFTIVDSVIGGLPGYGLTLIGVAAAVGVGAMMIVVRTQRQSTPLPQESAMPDGGRRLIESTAILVFLMVPGVAYVVASLLSVSSNFLIPRCLAMPIPLLMIVFAAFVATQFPRASQPRVFAPMIAGVAGFVLVVSLVRLYNVLLTPRSNAREVAALVSVNVEASDLVIVAPEWYSSVFDHYFAQSAEQIDYPYDGRSGMIDFSNVWSRTVDPLPLKKMRLRLASAIQARRRVWLITGKQYSREFTTEEIEEAMREHQPGPAVAVRVKEMRSLLSNAYGPPRKFPGIDESRAPRYDVLRAYVYSPR